jgi:hypothetical protein
MLSRSSQSQIGSKASSTTWVPLKALPDLEIIEIEPVIVDEFLHGRCLRSQQALKCPSSFHYSDLLPTPAAQAQ